MTTHFIRLVTQFENVGDALISRALVDGLSRFGPVVALIRPEENVFNDDVLNGIPNVSTTHSLSSFWRQMVRASITDKARFIYLPGAVIGEKGCLSAFAGFGQALALRLGRIRTYRIGVSYGSLGKRNRGVVRRVARITDCIAVRDGTSAELLSSLGRRPDCVVPDLSFSYYVEERLFHSGVQDSAIGDKAIAFSFRADRSGDLSIDDLMRFVSAIMNRQGLGRRALFVSQVRRDDEFNERLCERYVAETNRDAELVRCHRIGDAFRTYCGVETIFSNRLHVLLMAARAGAVPVPLVRKSADSKIIAIFEELGLSENVVYAVEDLAVSSPQQIAPSKGHERGEIIAGVFAAFFGDSDADKRD